MENAEAVDSGARSIEQEYAQQIARAVAARLPYGALVFFISFAVALVFEYQAHPDRLDTFLGIFAVEALLCGLAMAITKKAPASSTLAVKTAILTSICLIMLVTTYHTVVSGELEVLGITLAYLVVGTMVLFPWGVWGQTAVAAASVLAYLAAIGLGVSALTPVGVSFLGLTCVVVLTVVGALLDERSRLSLFRRDVALQRANMALEREIAEHRRTDEELRKERHFISTVLDTAGALVLVLDRQGRIVRFNRACERTTGYTFDELRGQPIWNLLPPEYVGPLRAAFDELRAAQFPNHREGTWVTRDGRRRAIAWSNTALVDREGFVEYVITTGVDVTERKQAEEFIEEEGKISAALAKVGRALISALDTPLLLDRLCEVSAQVLDCESSHTLLWRPDEDVYVPVAGYGATPEEQEIARIVRVPRSRMSVLLSRLEHDDVGLVGTVPDDLLSETRYDPAAKPPQLCMALRRGNEVIGIQVGHSRNPNARIKPKQLRIARGISQLASLALQNARLVEDLERASNLKSEFLSTISHELRTPLNVIIGYNSLLLEGAFGALTAEQTEPIDRIDRSARQLLELITETLDLGRLESGQIKVDVEPVHVSTLVDEVNGETRELQERVVLAFAWRVAPDLPRLLTDPLKLKVVLKNLVTNAIKFTEQGGVTVSAQRHGNGIEFCVSDTGTGIPPESQASIFEPFHQADGPSTRRHGGVGLGLHIVRRLLDLLGGTVALESEVGRGSTFRVWIPCEANEIAASPSAHHAA